MALKLNISDKGKTWKLESDVENLAGKSIGDHFDGKVVKPELQGYDLEITGGSDSSGFPMYKKIEGIGLKRVLLTKGWGMHKRSKGIKKRVSQPRGLRLRKTVRGKMISEKTIQVNIKVLNEGSKKLETIFPEQNKPKEPKAKKEKKESVKKEE